MRIYWKGVDKGSSTSTSTIWLIFKTPLSRSPSNVFIIILIVFCSAAPDHPQNVTRLHGWPLKVCVWLFIHSNHNVWNFNIWKSYAWCAISCTFVTLYSIYICFLGIEITHSVGIYLLLWRDWTILIHFTNDLSTCVCLFVKCGKLTSMSRMKCIEWVWTVSEINEHSQHLLNFRQGGDRDKSKHCNETI